MEKSEEEEKGKGGKSIMKNARESVYFTVYTAAQYISCHKGEVEMRSMYRSRDRKISRA